MPRPKPEQEHDFERPISDGPNARPRDETIDQAAGGEPDDSSRAVEISPEEERKIADSILNGPTSSASHPPLRADKGPSHA